eukprot:6329031-Amphidinium_carterae.1
MSGQIPRARSAWYETCQQQNRMVVASCVLLPLYINALLLACTVVADHLRFHVVGMRRQTCDAEFDANDTASERRRIQIE